MIGLRATAADTARLVSHCAVDSRQPTAVVHRASFAQHTVGRIERVGDQVPVRLLSPLLPRRPVRCSPPLVVRRVRGSPRKAFVRPRAHADSSSAVCVYAYASSSKSADLIHCRERRSLPSARRAALVLAAAAFIVSPSPLSLNSLEFFASTGAVVLYCLFCRARYYSSRRRRVPLRLFRHISRGEPGPGCLLRVMRNDPDFGDLTSATDYLSSTVGDPTQRDGFRLEVKVFDGKFSATTKLFVKVDDRNDNAPEIHGPARANVSEDAARGALVARFTTFDKDLDGKDTATFRIARESDPKRQFSISQGGELTVAQPLDREDIPYYNLRIEAFDEVGNVGSQRIEIYLIDVNDNAPDLYTVPDPCIFMENTDPGQIPPCEIFGKDPDTRPNGPPFTMRVDPSYPFLKLVSIVFDPTGDGGNGSMSVKASVRFDREDPSIGKVLNIPIFVKDSGANATEARRIVPIIIGDENDNPMSDGSMTILVNSYLGQLEKTVIGRVYVTDKDDWDLPDKTFEWSQSLPGFELNPNNGQITMEANKAPGSYDLSASVVDHKRNEKAIGTVTVVVKEIPAVAFHNQGAIRLLGQSKDSQAGITKAQFIQLDEKGQSPMTKFIAKLSNYLGGVQVDVFSVMDGVAVKQNSEVNVVDVRYAAHGSPYRSSVLLNGVVSQHRAEFEQDLGIGGVAVTDGGQYPAGVADVSPLNGCVRNLVVNNDLYDLATPAYSEGSSIGCKLWGSACDSNSVESSSYCINGDCWADAGGKPNCDCDPGYRGDRCEKEIQWVQFGAQSFIEYLMKVPLKSTTTKVDVLFVAGQQSTGELGYGKSTDLKKYISTSVDGYLPTAKFDLDFKEANGQPSTPVQLQMSWLRLSNNGSYWLQFDRNPTRASLSIDGVYQVDQLLDPRTQNFAMTYDDRLMIGADTTSGTKDFQGCVGDFRWDDTSLPLVMSDEENLVAPIHNQKGVVAGCSLRQTCAQVSCPGGYVCRDFWKGPLCTCPPDATANIGEDGTLIGCGATLAVSSLGISSKAVVLILICLLVLIKKCSFAIQAVFTVF
uniref:Neural-cadherin n=1 Tax=Plectus sambesii TaxID=2011161 RepID=A0A914VF49_9BILA